MAGGVKGRKTRMEREGGEKEGKEGKRGVERRGRKKRESIGDDRLNRMGILQGILGSEVEKIRQNPKVEVFADA